MKNRKGLGSIYQKLRKKNGRKVKETIYYISYYIGRKRFRECANTGDYETAQKLLIKRLHEGGSPLAPGDEASKTTFNELVDYIRADYKRKQNRTWDRVEHAIKHLRPEFEHIPAAAVTYDRVSRYIERRQDDNASLGTIHHELAALKRMLRLWVKVHRLPSSPDLPTIKLDNVRGGFFTDDEVHAVLRQLPDWYAPAIKFAWLTGWRIGEVKSLTWAQVDFGAGTVRLDPGTTKNRDGRTFPFAALPPLAALLRAQRERTDQWQRDHGQIVPWVFWRRGKRLADHRDTWNSACKRAGLPGKLVHDLRRTAVRNLERASISRSVAMKLTGHKTESIYRRYAIVSETDLAEAVQKLSATGIGHPSGTEPHRNDAESGAADTEKSL